MKAQYGDFSFWPIWGREKSDFSKLVPETANYGVFVSNAESSLTSKYAHNKAILDFHRFEVSKNSSFNNSSRRPQLVSFVLVSQKGG